MSLKTATFDVEGQNIPYTAEITNGEISGIFGVGVDNAFSAVDPNSNLFSTAAENQTVLDGLSIDLYSQTGLVDSPIFQSNEQLVNNYNVTSKDNKEFVDETSDNINPLVGQSTGTLKSNIPDTLKYPFDIDINQDHLKIQQFEYKRPPSGVQASRPGSTPDNADNVKGKPYGKFGGSVLLPMPKVSDSNGAEWGKSDLNVFGLGFASIAGGLIDAATGEDTAFDDLRASLGEDALKDTDNISQGNILRQNIFGNKDAGINNLSGVGQVGLAIGAQELSKFAGVNLSADEVLARTSGKILNPNAELLFQGPVLRDFGFKFLMIARGQKEAAEIRKIIKFFKVGAAPVFSDGPALLGTPNVFQLEYRAGKRTLETVNRFNEMALRTITVDYAPDGFWSAYQDSHPVAVVMSLQFSELRPLYQRDHEYGGEVGY